MNPAAAAPPPPGATVRLFLALWPDADVRRALARHRDAWSWSAGNGTRPPAPVRNDKLHVTLHFIGGVAPARLPELRTGLAVASPGFELAFGQPEVWKHGIAVLNPLAVSPQLTALHGALADRLHGLGLPTETREFRPHVTLARHAQQALPPPQVPEIVWRVDSYALVESRMHDGGDYRVLARYPCS